MAQTQLNVAVADQASADNIVAKTENLTGVKFVNVNIDKGTIVITHDDTFDVEIFKTAAGI